MNEVFHKGDKVKIVNLDDWTLPQDNPEQYLGKEGIVVKSGSWIEVDIPLVGYEEVEKTTLWKPEELTHTI